MERPDNGIFVASAAVRSLLSSGATPSAIRARLRAVTRLANDIAEFVGWPALEQSLRADAAALQAAIEGLS